MSSIAISYGENGAVFCGLKSDGSHSPNCYGSNPSIIHATPIHTPFHGLTAGNGFICGLQMYSNKPFCWGSTKFISMGVNLQISKNSEYLDISAGDHFLCGLRKPLKGKYRYISLVDCWGYNMTKSYNFDGQIQSISAGSVFSCGLFAQNRSVFCWGDDSASNVISLMPNELRFKKIASGGYHVCGILEGVSSRVVCWGRSLDLHEEIDIGSVLYNGQLSVDLAPEDAMISVVGAKFHACGIRSYDRRVVCWGYRVERSTSPPSGVKLYQIAGGDYFACGVLAETSLSPVCWGVDFPSALPLAVSPGLCRSTPCSDGFYEFNNASSPCHSPGSHICLPCSKGCPNEMHQIAECGLDSDRQCGYNCSSCSSNECVSKCSNKSEKLRALQLPIIVAEVCFGVFLISAVSLGSILYVRYKLRNCRCSVKSKKGSGRGSFHKESGKIRPDLDELNIRRAQRFTYEELERATSGFKDESVVGKGSFSCVFKGVLKDGTIVAVKKAILTPDLKKNSNEFHTELDLLSRLNHAHLLNLLGYCEENGERLLVYEFMANGSLHEHLHCKNKDVKEQLDWVRRVTIAVQAARGIEYLHGYACPPVIHRDIKSSNILIDEEHNARVADFGLSLLGPANSSSPLAELPAGTLGYLDPEYYRLHYLTTKSDVYSFGVLLLEILSGRKAIDMQYEEGNIVEWAVPLIKAGNIESLLDPVLKPPSDLESLKRIANVASKCVRMRGKERPSMDKVTTGLERALALLMGSPCNEQPILPTEVVLGSSRMHKKCGARSETDGPDIEDQRIEFTAPSWITFPSVASSQRRKSSVSDSDVDFLPKISIWSDVTGTKKDVDSVEDGPLYDSSAYTECKVQPEEPLYNGGLLKDQVPNFQQVILDNGDRLNNMPSFLLQNLDQGTKYCFSIWIKINGGDSALVRASLVTEETVLKCIGTVIAKQGCWSFLKGGFVLSSPSKLSTLYIQNSDGKDIKIATASASLQPFTELQWRLNQETKINEERKRAVTIHVSDRQGMKLQGASVEVEQVSKDFPFGSAIAKTIIGNSRYQKWFTERFNAAVFENELKWDATEPKQGQVNYTVPDQMLEFVRSNQIRARGHNIFWENPKTNPKWVLNLTGPDLESAVTSRIQSLLNKYKEEFIHWDVSNEMLHFDFYEKSLGPNATLQFFETAHRADPLATLFMNEFNVVETCSDVNSTVDTYVSRMRELQLGGVSMDGIGLQGHFDTPNLPLMRGIIDKLATLGLPIWLTEVDISNKFSKEKQAIYLEEVLREGFSHSAINGIMLWTALRQGGCYQMCLTDDDFNNLPAGDTVDILLKEWQTGILEGQTDEHGSYSFFGFLGDYRVTAKYGTKTVGSTFSLSRGKETKHFNIQL
ncbi:hypothetical protein BUALT_Bualt19G0124900 [Buddleja alternifolia]|uniref:non-specific serine/threonine protein kinase n=1 Tax=Buddleja alternifolia TaxID=168488 RepID=A0AAV6W6W9_9LAMI|nr:hypothetical protein BUALT_Bualt19G0124900 [Buddleja alternifolia]